jgi:ABC-type multidrug transport system ATPase subunit
MNTAEPLIDVQNLAKHFGARTALQDLSLRVRAGEVQGLVGANGGGKTTTLRILGGLLKPDAGRGTVASCDLLRAARDIRRNVGYLSQRFALYPTLSVRENLRFRAAVFGVTAPRGAADAAIEEFALQGFARTPSGELSGGYARLLQLAATLLHRPRLLLLDEPTAGLDAWARQEVWRRITALAAGGAAVVVSTHDLADAERCSTIILLSDGEVRAQGSPRAITDSSGALALLASGSSVLALAPDLEQCAAVVASYPQGGQLRIVATADGFEAVAAVARRRGCRIEASRLSFEDAALLLLRPMRGTAP